jgi:hypothetical protein
VTTAPEAAKPAVVATAPEAVKPAVQKEIPAALPAAVMAKPPADIPDPAKETERWVSRYKAAVDSTDEPAFMEMQEALEKYLKDNPDVNIPAMMFRHQGIAAAQKMEAAASELLVKTASRGAMGTKAIVLDARIDGFDVDKMIPAISKLAGKGGLHFCVITKDETLLERLPKEIHDNVLIVSPDVAGATPEEILAGVKALAGEIGFEELSRIKASDMVITANAAMAVQYLSGVKGPLAQTFNFMLIGETTLSGDELGERMTRLVPTIAAMSVLDRQFDVNNAAKFIALVGNEGEAGAIKDDLTAKGLEKIVEGILFISKLDVGARVKEFMASLRAMETSL